MTQQTVSADQVTTMQRELDEVGYTILRGVVSPDKLAEFHEYISAEFQRSPRFKGGGMLTGHLNCYPGHAARFAWEELEAADIVAAVHQIRAGRDNRMRSTMNFNMPGSVAQHYHIDGAYLDDFLVCNVAVVDTTLANGAMDILPGTNRTFLPFWKYALRREYHKTTRLEMKAGDVLLRKSHTWHRGMPNRSAEARPLLSYTFGEKGASDGDPFELNDGQPEFYANWYSTSRAGQIREQVYKKVPMAYAAYRFVTSIGNRRGYASW
jgi:ectoine hydroxylase-related dioxygenase (phytanoyl-CoA dioxygenase family)